jgi:hypothetical protein
MLSSFVGAVTRNWQLKLLSLAVALVIWAVVVNAEKGEVVLSVPVEFQEIPEGLEVAQGRSQNVEARLRGLRLALSRLSGDDLRAIVDLSGARPGESAVRILPEHVRAPFGVQVLGVSPSRIRVALKPAAPAGARQ